MKERGMIFNGEMVRAILDGRKTQTRRPIKWKQTRFTEMAERDDGSLWPWAEDCERGGDIWFACPFGEVGDRIWVRETFCAVPDHEEPAGCSALLYAADGNGPYGKWTPSIHMPRWASRLTLEITGVRVERLNAISEEDAQAEGVQPACYEITPPEAAYRVSFGEVWRSIYGEESWAANPWVWVIEFKRVEGGAA
ncbi:hypothetical protein FNH63_22785 [Salmonella enterica subsp. salamae]|nr:hypothetical protein [Salmonella enterica]ECJ5920237.1 hypothetical protein [Salmonella enterica subsp. salamae]ECN5160596.1 hypothetical protein [Salmonella enterica subsp. enterica serovar Newport]EBP4576574.1 hypothetical protein [Salmonella enterica]ECJ6128996.1 hypothetical protein [Salmonella enterica]